MRMTLIKSGFSFLVVLFLLALAWVKKDFSILLVAGAATIVFLMVVFGKKFSAGIVLVSVLLAVAAADFIVGMALSNQQTTFSDPESDYARGYFSSNADLGYQPEPGEHTSRKIAAENGETIYDVVYTVGSDGFRYTPSSQEKPITINMFGGSFIFGEGLNDNETLPYYLSETLDLAVKSYGVHGYGMHQALAILQRSSPPDGEINIFLTAPWHALRSACKPGYATGTPKYVLDRKVLVRDGVCLNPAGLSGIAAKILSQSNIFNYLIGLKSNTGVITSDDLDLYFAIMNEAYNVSKSRGQKVIIAFIKANSEDLKDSGLNNHEISRQLSKASDFLVDVTLAEYREELDPRYYIHELDQHPSAEANRARAKMLAEIISTIDR